MSDIPRRADQRLWATPNGAVWLAPVMPAIDTLEATARAGALDPSNPALAQAIDTAPREPLAWFRLGQALVLVGNPGAARDALQRAVDLRGGFTCAERALARVELTLGLTDAARLRLATVCARRPGDGEPMVDLARVAMSNGDRAGHRDWLHRAVAADPQCVDALNNLAGVHFVAGELDRALPLYRRALRTGPRRVDVRINLASLLTSAGRPDEACRLWDRVPDQAPWRSQRCIGMAEAMEAGGQGGAAAQLLAHCCAEVPDDGAAWCALADLHRRAGRTGAALSAYRRAEICGGLSAPSLINRSAALLAAGRNRAAANALALARQRAASRGTLLEAGSAQLLMQQYTGAPSRERTARRHAAWGRIAVRGAGAKHRPHRGRVERIGFLSPDLRFHPVAFFAEPLFEHLAAHGVECVVYDTRGASDSYRHRLATHATAWHGVARSGDAEVVRRMSDDRLDALVDLSGHTGGHRLAIMAERSAPLQVSWLGYPGSTGLPSVDLRVSDHWLDPEADAERFYAESLARLPVGFTVYRPPDEAPPVARMPDGALRIGCLNSITKFGPAMLALMGEVMRTLPDATLVLQGSALDESGGQRRLLRLLALVGVDAGRVEMHGATDFASHLALHSGCHVALDSAPWNGHTTSCHALWMGVPVVSLRGDAPCARMGASVLARAGLADLVADSEGGVASRLAALDADRSRLRVLRAGMRERLRSHPLLDGERFTREFLGALQAHSGAPG